MKYNVLWFFSDMHNQQLRGRILMRNSSKTQNYARMGLLGIGLFNFNLLVSPQSDKWQGKWPCGVSKKGVGNNSILCHGCKRCIHEWCSGVKGSLRNASQSFIYRCCTVDRPITDGLNTDLHLDNGNGVSLEKVDKFCYLGDKLGYWHQRADESDGNPPPR